MAYYQNIFTRVQVHGGPGSRIPLPAGPSERGKTTAHSYWLGKFGDAQLGPVYLGWTGVTSIICGIIRHRDYRVEHVGFGQLGPRPVRAQALLAVRLIRRSRIWLSIPPMAEGGWWLLAGFFLTTSILLWWVRTYRRAPALAWARMWPGPLRRRSGSISCSASSARS